jgi:hypothetical protein
MNETEDVKTSFDTFDMIWNSNEYYAGTIWGKKVKVIPHKI